MSYVSNDLDILKKWNYKWEMFIHDKVEGENRLKMIVDLGEEGITFLENLRFTEAYWEESTGTDPVFNVEFVSDDDIIYAVNGRAAFEFELFLSPDIELFDEKHLIELLNEFNISEMVNENDPRED